MTPASGRAGETGFPPREGRGSEAPGAAKSGRFVGRKNAVKRLAPLEGQSGRSVYAEGTARFERPGRTLVARPPFSFAHEAEYDFVHVRPLLDFLNEDRLVGAVLVRLGGYAVGVFDGERLVASKVGQRYVHGRHRAGGSSANRFRRRRDEQARALLLEAGDTAARVLEPFRGKLDAVALGGDREAVRKMLELRPELTWLDEDEVKLERFFSVPEPRQAVLERLPYDVYAVELREIDHGGAVG